MNALPQDANEPEPPPQPAAPEAPPASPPVPPGADLDRRNRLLKVAAGFLGWFLVNGLLGGFIFELGLKYPTPAAVLSLLAFIINIGGLILLAVFPRTRPIALGVLIAVAALFLLSIIAGVILTVVCLFYIAVENG